MLKALLCVCVCVCVFDAAALGQVRKQEIRIRGNRKMRVDVRINMSYFWSF